MSSWPAVGAPLEWKVRRHALTQCLLGYLSEIRQDLRAALPAPRWPVSRTATSECPKTSLIEQPEKSGSIVASRCSFPLVTRQTSMARAQTASSFSYAVSSFPAAIERVDARISAAVKMAKAFMTSNCWGDPHLIL